MCEIWQYFKQSFILLTNTKVEMLLLVVVWPMLFSLIFADV